MWYVKNSRGYTMLLALVAVVLFSILGITLMSLTSSGIVKNETRLSTVQAKDLADKGIDFAVNSVQNKLVNSLKDANGNFALTKGEFERLLLETLNNPSLACPQELFDIKTADFGIIIDGDIENTKTLVCIDKIEELPVDIDNPEKNKYKRYVTFKSYGISNGKHEVTSAKIAIGTDAIPDQLKYAVSSNEGSIYFHGGVEVTGDIKTSQNIYIAKKAFMDTVDSPNWYDSVPLKINKTIGSASAKLIMNNPDATLNYFYKTSSFREDTRLSYNNPDEVYTAKDIDKIRGILTNSEKTNIITKSVDADSIEVDTEVSNMKNSNKVDYRITERYIYNPDYFDRNETDTTLMYCKRSHYDSNCSNSIFNSTTVHLDQENHLKIQGTYYINGDLSITNSTIYGNAVLYVNGNVNIQYSKINSLNNGTLIIFASGNIKISNISEYQNNPSEIRGFFYSENDMTLYGVGSNIKIIGGISANNLYLTALRGYNNSGQSYDQKFNVSITHQLSHPSRLQIIYDENVIKQFTKFKRDEEEEFITQINDPETLERY